MTIQSDEAPDLAEQTLNRTTAPAASGQEMKRPAHGHEAEDDHDDGDHEHALEWPEMLRIALVAAAAAAVWWHLWEPFRAISVIGVAGLMVGGWPIYKEALENLVAKRMTMELSMSIAIIAAAAISEFFTALVITLFVLVAEVLEGMTVSRGRRAIRDLLDFLPRAVSVRRGAAVAEVDTDALAVGDAVLVNPGGRIPVDGTVVAGHSFVDQARITGESLPIEKTAGAPVFAGSINQSGALEIRAERIGRDTSYGKIIEAVEQAERSRAPVQRLADRLAGYLVYFALGAAVLTYLITRDIRSTISVVIVAGACGIAAGTPLAILGAIGRAARAGAIIKGGLYLEQLGRVNTVVLDKTGTLTFGKPEVRKLLPAAGADITQLLETAASAELRSEHPLGKTIVAHARTLGLALKEPERFGYTPGRGIDALLDGELVLIGNQALMRDRMRHPRARRLACQPPGSLGGPGGARRQVARRDRYCRHRAPRGGSSDQGDPRDGHQDGSPHGRCAGRRRGNRPRARHLRGCRRSAARRQTQARQGFGRCRTQSWRWSGTGSMTRRR